MREVYYQTPQVCLWFESEKALGGGTWVGDLPSAAYREAFLASNQLITEKSLKIWLANNLKLKHISQQDLEWTLERAPLVMASGLQKMATVVSEDVFNHMAIIGLFDRANPLLTFENQYFRDEPAALEWLLPELTPALPRR